MVDGHRGGSEETHQRKGLSRDLSNGQRPGRPTIELSRAEGKATDEAGKASKQWPLEGPCASMVRLPLRVVGNHGWVQI